MLMKNRQKGGKSESWSDVVLSSEYKPKDGDEQLDDVSASWEMP